MKLAIKKKEKRTSSKSLYKHDILMWHTAKLNLLIVQLLSKKWYI